MKINKKNWLPEDPEKNKKNLEECKYCFKLWCDWSCINKLVLGVIEKDKDKVDKENLLDNHTLFESKNYFDEINKIKNQILELLLAVDFKSINWEYLTSLWSDIIDYWILIWLWESLTIGNNNRLNEDCFNNNYNTFNTNIFKNTYVKTLRDFESDFVFSQEKAEYIIKLFIKSISEYSWKTIIERWELLRKIWEEMQMSEVNIKFCKIIKWV